MGKYKCSFHKTMGFTKPVLEMLFETKGSTSTDKFENSNLLPGEKIIKTFAHISSEHRKGHHPMQTGATNIVCI